MKAYGLRSMLLATALAVCAASASGQCGPTLPAHIDLKPVYGVDPNLKGIHPELKALADTERAFAKLGAEKGVRESFMAYFAPDGIWFTPHPKNTIEELKSRPAPAGPLPRRLEWAPMYGDVARSGDFGYDTGPSKITDLTGANPPRYGYFFSIWKKQPNGDWRVALDLGTQNPADEWDPAHPPEFTQAPASGFNPDAPRRIPGGVDPVRHEVDTLLMAERAAARASQTKGIVTALVDFADPTLRWHRNFSSPRVGVNEIQKDLASRDTDLRWDPLVSYVAKSADLAYTYGRYTAPTWGKDGTYENGYYVHVWRKDAQGKWKLVFHVDNPLPPR